MVVTHKSDVKTEIATQFHRALDVRVFLRWTQVLLPFPLPHGLQVIGVEGDSPACRHLLHANAPPEARGTKDELMHVERGA